MKKKLKEICTIEKGKQIDTKALNDSNSYRYINGGIKESGFYNDFNTSGETVLISEGGASCGYVNYVNEQFWCGCHCYRLTDINAFPKFLFYSLKASQNEIMELRTGAAMPNIKKESLKNFEISIIEDKEEQIKIAAELDTIQSAIDNKKQQLSLLDEAVKSEFVEMFGENPVESGKWKVERLGNLCTITSGGTPDRKNEEYWKNGTIPWVKTTELQNNELSIVEEYITEKGLDESAAKIVPEETILLAMYGQGKTRGMTAFLKIQASTNQACACILPTKSKELSQRFIWYFLIMNYENIRNLAVGCNQLNLNSNLVKSIQIPIPPLDLQNQFAAFVQQIDKSKFVAKQQITDLQELLDSKMQEYFS